MAAQPTGWPYGLTRCFMQQKQTIFFKNKPRITCGTAITGPKEHQGPLKDHFKHYLDDDRFGEKSYEKAECKMMSFAINDCLKKAGLTDYDIDAVLAGDILNQIISASFSARGFSIPFLGQYSACATFSQALLLGAALTDGGYMNRVLAATCSHFSTAERQYRFPLELGNTRPPSSQWTVTAAGCSLISKTGKGPKITAATVGKVIDFGIDDANNMGAAMAPSVKETLVALFNHTETKPADYDMILTGDLGYLGSRLLKDLMWEKGLDISNNHKDCGVLIYNTKPDEYQGGSGAGCSAAVFNTYILDLFEKKKLNKIILTATGALLSPTSSFQGETIPGIAHAVIIEK